MAIRIFLIAALLLVPLIVSTVQAEGLPPVCYKKRQKCCYEFEPCGKVTKDVKKYYACPGSDYTSCYKEETYEYPKFCSKEEPHCDTHELLEGTEEKPEEFVDEKDGGILIKTEKADEATEGAAVAP